MKKFNCKHIFLFILLTCLPLLSSAWNNSIQIGYGYSHDPNHTKYNNSGVLLSGDLYPISRSDWTFWSINGAVGQWYTTTPVHKNVTTAALSLALRLYPFTFGNNYQSYLLGALGPAYLSDRRYGYNTQAGNLTLQTMLGLGAEFHCFDVNLRLEHFSNAGIEKPNEGFNILYLLSIGYLF